MRLRHPDIDKSNNDIDKSNIHGNMWYLLLPYTQMSFAMASQTPIHTTPPTERIHITITPDNDFTPDDRSGPYQCDVIALPLHTDTYSLFVQYTNVV